MSFLINTNIMEAAPRDILHGVLKILIELYVGLTDSWLSNQKAREASSVLKIFFFHFPWWKSY